MDPTTIHSTAITGIDAPSMQPTTATVNPAMAPTDCYGKDDKGNLRHKSGKGKGSKGYGNSNSPSPTTVTSNSEQTLSYEKGKGSYSSKGKGRKCQE